MLRADGKAEDELGRRVDLISTLQNRSEHIGVVEDGGAGPADLARSAQQTRTAVRVSSGVRAARCVLRP